MEGEEHFGRQAGSRVQKEGKATSETPKKGNGGRGRRRRRKSEEELKSWHTLFWKGNSRIPHPHPCSAQYYRTQQPKTISLSSFYPPSIRFYRSSTALLPLLYRSFTTHSPTPEEGR